MNAPTPESAIGHPIEEIDVWGIERDGNRHWVGAEIWIRVSHIGRFSFSTVTKYQFVSEAFERYFEISDALAAIDFKEVLKERPPFVLNDRVLTWEVLERKFKGRIVEADLADSLWPLDPDDDELDE